MITLKRLGERLAATAQAVDRILGLSAAEDFLADHEDGADALVPKSFDVALGEERLKVYLATLRQSGGLVCMDLSISLESDVIAEGRDGELLLTLKKSPLSRKSRIKVEANFKRTDDPEGLELIRESLNQQEPKEDGDGR